MRIKKILILGMFAILGIVSHNNVSALSGSVVLDKAYLEGVYTCYTGGHIKTGSGAQSPITVNDFPVFATGPTSWTDNVNGTKQSFLVVNDADGLVLLPTGLTGIDDNDLRCNELFIGYNGAGGSFDGLFGMNGVTTPGTNASPETKSAFLEGLGYVKSTTSSTSGVCSAVNFTKTVNNVGSSDIRSYSLCGDNLDNGKITSTTTLSQSENGGDSEVLTFSISGVNLSVTVPVISKVFNSQRRVYEDMYTRASFSFVLTDYNTWDDFMNAVANTFTASNLGFCQSWGGDGGTYTSCTRYSLKLTNTFTSSPTTEVFQTFSISNINTAANTAIRYFSGTDSMKQWSDLEYSDAQEVALYQTYLTDVFGVEYYDNNCAAVTESESERIILSGYKKVNWNTGSGTRTCYVKSSKESSVTEVNGIKENKHFGEKITSDGSNTAMQKLIDVLNSITLVEGEFDDGDTVIPGNTESVPTCGNSDGAGSLGWIVCPVLQWLGDAAGDIYTDFLEPSLKVDPVLFNETENAGTKQGWTIFQGIANVLFIIMLLVVIFSQLTGVGIDNYGIKKILPKLIIAAILVNLSYYICVIFVDLSNILGNGLQSLFSNLPTNVSAEVTAEVSKGSAAGATLLSVGLISAMAAGAVWVVWSNPAILLSLLVGALGVLISVVFLFILLAGREAAIVVLTVISPLAFVCYMLPNTKKLFDKWWKLGEGLLLVYPIAGLLVGGGNYVSKLLLSSGAAANSFVSALTAMLVGIVPIFFIPTVLKGSFAAMGNLGARISGFGDRLRGGVTRGIRGSERYKDAQQRGLERRTRINAGYDRNGNRQNLNAFQRFMRGGRRNMQFSALKYQKQVSDRGSLEATEGADFMLQAETANEMKQLVASGDINNTATLQAGLTRALQSGNRAQIRAYTDALAAKGEDGRVAVKRGYDNAVAAPGGISRVSAQTFANNIMANHAADFKNNNRSMFAVAQGINTGTAPVQTVSSYIGNVANQAALADKVTSTTIGNMDDDAFEEIFGGYHGAPVVIPTGASAAEIGAAAYAALNDQNANIKAERRRYLQDIVRASGYTPSTQTVTVSGPVDANILGGTVDANVTNPVLDVQGTVNVGNEVDVNVRQSRGGQVNPVQVQVVEPPKSGPTILGPDGRPISSGPKP